MDKKELGQPGDFAGLQTPEEVLAFVAKELGADTAAALSKALARDDKPAEPAPVDALPTHTTDTIN